MKAKSTIILIIMIAVIALTSAVSYKGIGEKNQYGVAKIRLGLDLAGGVSITYKAEYEEGEGPTDKNEFNQDMKAAEQLIRERLDRNNYTEAEAYIEGEDRIRVDIPGVDDVNQAVKEIGQTAQLRFVGISQADLTEIQTNLQASILQVELPEPVETEELSESNEVEATQEQNQEPREENTATEENKTEETEQTNIEETKTEADDNTEQPTITYEDYIKKMEEYNEKFYEALKEAEKDGRAEFVLDGRDVKTATYQYGALSQNASQSHYVDLEFNSDGAKKFEDATTKFTNELILIMLDDKIISSPQVNGTIAGGKATISGSFTKDSAVKLANLIDAGALPFNLVRLESSGVGAKLGSDAIEGSLKAGLIGIVLVFLFMIIYYRVPGVAASLALVFYASLLLLLISAMEITLTLPGVAGIILSIGMAVDANVIIFSRIKEEVNTGKAVRASVRSGFQKALSAILDGNITTLIASFALYRFGTGPIKGFAQTLALGIVVSMFTALLVTRIILNQLTNLGIRNPKLYGAK